MTPAYSPIKQLEWNENIFPNTILQTLLHIADVNSNEAHIKNIFLHCTGVAIIKIGE